MKYAGEQVREWVIDKLTNAVVVDGFTSPVVNIAEMDLEPPYIAIINQTQGNQLTKDGKSAEMTLLIQCITRFEGDYGGDWYADNMASEVSEIMTGADGTTTDFNIAVMAKDANESTTIINKVERVIVRQLSYRLIVTQL